MKTSINNLKNGNLPSCSIFSHLHQRLLKSFNEAAISLRHLGKSILEGNLYLGTLAKYCEL